MFSILDGREYFYQWDLDRKISVNDKSITQLHFTNATTNNALVVVVKDLEADVPNILLQESWDIIVYGYDDNHTRYEQRFEVKKRSKPESYVYTETEVLNYNTLVQELQNINENIEATVEEYLVENPPEIDVDLTGYATEDYVKEAIAAIPEVDLEGYATEKYVDDAVAALDIPDTSGLATEKYVDDAIANLDIPEAEVDLSNYYTKEEVDEKDYALTSEIASCYKKITDAGYQTAAQVETAINEALGVIENGTY